MDAPDGAAPKPVPIGKVVSASVSQWVLNTGHCWLYRLRENSRNRCDDRVSSEATHHGKRVAKLRRDAQSQSSL